MPRLTGHPVTASHVHSTFRTGPANVTSTRIDIQWGTSVRKGCKGDHSNYAPPPRPPVKATPLSKLQRA